MNLAQITEKMLAFSQGNLHDINHFLMVHSFARAIAMLKWLDERMLFIVKADYIVNAIEKRMLWMIRPIRKFHALLLIFFMLQGSFLGASARNERASLPAKKRFNIYIWNGIPSMHYHRVLAEVSVPQNPSGTVVIICPGGSYHHLDILNEGKPTQKWFSQQGATAIILRYRTANRNYHYPAQMQDIQRMIQLVRENPRMYGADFSCDSNPSCGAKSQAGGNSPSDENPFSASGAAAALRPLKVGLIGFSAGGHLVTWAGAFAGRVNELEKIGIRTQASLRPDFVIPVYPVVTMKEDIGHKWSRKSLIGKNPDEQTRANFSMEQQIPADMPPTYLVACHDDPVVIYENSVRLAQALEAAGTDFCFTDYPWGGHGFGMKSCAFMRAFHWNQPLLEWLKERDFL